MRWAEQGGQNKTNEAGRKADDADERDNKKSVAARRIGGGR